MAGRVNALNPPLDAQGWTPLKALADKLFTDAFYAGAGVVTPVPPMSPERWAAAVVVMDREDTLTGPGNEHVRVSHPFEDGDQKCLIFRVRCLDEDWNAFVALSIDADVETGRLSVTLGEAANEFATREIDTLHRCCVVAAIRALGNEISEFAKRTSSSTITLDLSVPHCPGSSPMQTETASGLTRLWHSISSTEPQLMTKDLVLEIRLDDGNVLRLADAIESMDVGDPDLADVVTRLKAISYDAIRPFAVTLEDGEIDFESSPGHSLDARLTSPEVTDAQIKAMKASGLKGDVGRLLERAGHGDEGVLLVGPDYVLAMTSDAWLSEDWLGESLLMLEPDASSEGRRSRATAQLWDDFEESLRPLLAAQNRNGPTP